MTTFHFPPRHPHGLQPPCVAMVCSHSCCHMVFSSTGFLALCLHDERPSVSLSHCQEHAWPYADLSPCKFHSWTEQGSSCNPSSCLIQLKCPANAHHKVLFQCSIMDMLCASHCLQALSVRFAEYSQSNGPRMPQEVQNAGSAGSFRSLHCQGTMRQ